MLPIPSDYSKSFAICKMQIYIIYPYMYGWGSDPGIECQIGWFACYVCIKSPYSPKYIYKLFNIQCVHVQYTCVCGSLSYKVRFEIVCQHSVRISWYSNKLRSITNIRNIVNRNTLIVPWGGRKRMVYLVHVTWEDLKRIGDGLWRNVCAWL